MKDQPFWRRWLQPVVVLLAAVNLVALIAWTGPRGLRSSRAETRAAAARVERDRLGQKVAALRERAAAMKANAADRDRFYAMTGTELEELAAAHESIQSMAEAAGLRPGSRSTAHDEVKGTPLQKVRFSLPLTGSYRQLVGFLREVERSPRFLVVERIALREDREGAKLQVELSAFMRAPAADGGVKGGR